MRGMKLSDDELEFLEMVRMLNDEGKKLLWEYSKELENESALLDKPDIIENKKER